MARSPREIVRSASRNSIFSSTMVTILMLAPQIRFSFVVMGKRQAGHIDSGDDRHPQEQCVSHRYAAEQINTRNLFTSNLPFAGHVRCRSCVGSGAVNGTGSDAAIRSCCIIGSPGPDQLHELGQSVASHPASC